MWWVLGVYAALTVVAFLVGRRHPFESMMDAVERDPSFDVERHDDDAKPPLGFFVRQGLAEFWWSCFYPWTQVYCYLPGGRERRIARAKESIKEQLARCHAELEQHQRLHEQSPKVVAAVRDEEVSLFFGSGCECRKRWDYREVVEKGLYEEFSSELFPLSTLQYWVSLVRQSCMFLLWPGPVCVGLWQELCARKEED